MGLGVGAYGGIILGVIKGDSRSSDYSSNSYQSHGNPFPHLWTTYCEYLSAGFAL